MHTELCTYINYCVVMQSLIVMVIGHMYQYILNLFPPSCNNINLLVTKYVLMVSTYVIKYACGYMILIFKLRSFNHMHPVDLVNPYMPIVPM